MAEYARTKNFHESKRWRERLLSEKLGRAVKIEFGVRFSTS